MVHGNYVWLCSETRTRPLLMCSPERRLTLPSPPSSTSPSSTQKTLEELVPKETGREARIANKVGAREARAARQGSPEMREKDLMGSSTDSFRAAVQQRRAQQERKVDRRRETAKEKISEHQER